jgi:hypothetical protein
MPGGSRWRWCLALALLPLLSCREICACTPGLAAFVLYGDGPGTGEAGARTNLRVTNLSRPACASPGEPVFVEDEFPIDAEGRFRAALLTALPGSYCLRVTFFAGALDASDSASSGPLEIAIVHGELDSLLVVVPPP